MGNTHASPFYLLVHKDAVVGMDKCYIGNQYVKSVIEGIDNVMNELPKDQHGAIPENVMGETKENGRYEHFLDKPGSAERIGSKDREILVFGGLYSSEGDLWCVNTEMWSLERNGYKNVKIIEDATLVRETLHKKPAACNV